MQSMQRRIKIKLFIVQLVSIIPFLLFIFYLFDLWYDVRRSSVLETSISEVKQTAQYIRNTIKYAATVSNFLASDQHFIEIVRKQPETAQNTLANLVKLADDIDSIIVVDNKGSPLIANYTLTAGQKQESGFDRPYFQQVLKTNKPAISDPLIGLLSNKPLVIISSPIIVDGEIMAIVNVSYNLEKLKKPLDELATMDKDKVIFLLDKNNQIIYQPGKLLPQEEAEKNIFKELSLIDRTRKNNLEIIDNGSLPIVAQPVIGASVAIEDLGWIIITAVPVKTIFAPLFKIQSVIWLIIIAAAIFSASLFSYFLRKVKIIY